MDTSKTQPFESLIKGVDPFRNVHNEYDIGIEIGRGGFSVVQEAVHVKTGKKAAIKTISKTHETLHHKLQQEIDIMRMVVKSPKVVHLYDVYEDDQNVYIVMELLEGGTLLEKIIAKDHYTDHDAAQILSAVVSGINFCHSQGVVHRDMKPENLMCSTKEYSDLSDVKITDFGLAIVLKEGEYATGVDGTREYLAPEIIAHSPYGPAVDMWSIGCIAYTLLCGYHPFSANETTPLYTQIATGDWGFYGNDWKDIGDTPKDFVSQLLVVDPTQRMTAKQALLHPFLVESRKATSQCLRSSSQRLRHYYAQSKLGRENLRKKILT